MVEKGAQGSQHSDPDTRPFLCGVVEGFYGRPWTLTQRKHLFEKMEAWHMNSYLYAPKDDCKHRAFWRELYTVEEADHLQSLISAAHECNVDFIYAISPGLDITYSSSKEISSLKRKLDQVSQLGCKSFALLFDDIEAEMSKADKESFQSFAHAQVTVTNDIYQHLGEPNFLFCPTQYCTTRAVPTISTSEYLKTIGEQLAPDIDIMWTGDKVIPKEITVASLQPISQALKRMPVIWDNEHANDYDPRRMYLGPYTGRSPDLIPKLRGVLTNPNCEYGANFVAIHTLAAWSKCTVDGCSSLSANDTVSADIKLELGDSSSGPPGDLVPPPPDELPPHVYHPRLALKAAIKDWIFEFATPRNMWGPITKPQVGMNPTGIIQPIINTCMTSTTTTSSINSLLPSATISENGSGGSPASLPVSADTGGVGADSGLMGLPSASILCTNVTPMIPVMNSLVSSNEVIMERPAMDLNTLMSEWKPEPMETNLETDGSGVGSSPVSKANDVVMESSTNPPTPASVMQVDTGVGTIGGMVKSESTTMLCEPTSPGATTPGGGTLNSSEEGKLHQDQVQLNLENSDAITENDLQLICDLFYLPCEHGPEAVDILTEFYWLKTNAGVMLPDGEEGGSGSGQVALEEWQIRQHKFNSTIVNVKKAFDRLCLSVNREIVYNLYTYVWDLVGVLYLLKSYIDWLTLGKFSPNYKQLVIGTSR
jgi:protein O-GlcNAcase/histone acetyltransferase